ncbi:hypothetical protein HDU79_011961 [Rhizoclosmatium sp. JEL0117]|nr:hypothetical protein HDU79_011961 [Rhizoclosmatium sp. JEL0117]
MSSSEPPQPPPTEVRKKLSSWSFSGSFPIPRLPSTRQNSEDGSTNATTKKDKKEPGHKHPSWPALLSGGVGALRFFMDSLNTPTVDYSTFRRVRKVINMGASPSHPSTRIAKDYIPRLDDIILDHMELKDATGQIKSEWVSFPQDSPAEEDNDRIIMYVHGGAYCLCSRKTHRGITWKLAKYAKCKVLVFDYRLAPEHVFPLALHDAISVYSFLTNPPPLPGLKKYDPSKVVIMGDSAGGGLALALCLWIRDHGAEHRLKMPGGMGLLSPWMDLSHSMPSFRSNGKWDYLPDKVKDKILNENRNHYYVKDNSFLTNPLVSPLFATESTTSPLPPTLIQVGECERLRDENLAFASTKFINTPIELELYDAMIHVFQLFNTVYPLADHALQKLAAFAIRVGADGFLVKDFDRKMTRISNKDGFEEKILSKEEVDAYLSSGVPMPELALLEDSPESIVFLSNQVNQLILEDSLKAEPEKILDDDEDD